MGRLIGLLLAVGLLSAGPVVAHPGGHDSLEQAVQRYEDPARDAWQKPQMLVRLLGLKPGQVVADIGAGSGYFSRRLAQAVAPLGWVYALDIDSAYFPVLRDLATKQGVQNIVTRAVTPDNPNLDSESVHMVFLCNTLHHIQNRERYYDRLRDGLKSEGRLIVVDFFPDRGLDMGPPASERLSVEQVVKEMDDAGFEVTTHLDWLPYQYVIEGKK